MLAMPESDKPYRMEMLRKIGAAIRYRVPKTPAKNEAVIEALCIEAATVFAAQNHLPYKPEHIEALADAAYGAMAEWLERRRRTN